MTLGRVAFAVFALVLTMRAPAAAQGIFATNGAPAGPRTGLIVGQVVDAVTGDAVAGAVVRLTMRNFSSTLPTTPNGRVMADNEGRFFFADLPAGQYFLRASKEGHAGGAYGLRAPLDDGTFFSLTEGERRTDATLMLWKHGAIAGTVVDEAGEPVVGVQAFALRRDVIGGRVRFGGNLILSAESAPSATTDDRGMFRISDVVPGSYVIVVPSTQTTIPAATLQSYSQNPNVRREVMTATSELQVLGQPRTQQIGELALLTKDRVAAPPPVAADGRLSVYRTTYFPSATTAITAKEIVIKGGEERVDVSIALLPVPAVQVSGRLLTPDGSAPPPMAIRLVGESSADAPETGFETVTGVSEADGRFTLLAVPAGEYVFKTSSRVEILSRQNLPAFWALQRLSVGPRDLSDITVELRPAIRLQGRVLFRSANDQPRKLAPGVEFHPAHGDDGRFAASYDDGATFTVAAVGGTFVVSPNETNGWFVESVTLDGKDITDSAIDLRSVTTPLTIVYTDRPSTISGRVKDARGKPSETAAVLAFSTSPEHWTGYGFRPRRVKSVQVSRAGAYTFDNLPPGKYHIVAIDGDTADWADPKNLEALARQATTLTVAAGTPKTLDLTLEAIRWR